MTLSQNLNLVCGTHCFRVLRVKGLNLLKGRMRKSREGRSVRDEGKGMPSGLGSS